MTQAEILEILTALRKRIHNLEKWQRIKNVEEKLDKDKRVQASIRTDGIVIGFLIACIIGTIVLIVLG